MGIRKKELEKVSAKTKTADFGREWSKNLYSFKKDPKSLAFPEMNFQTFLKSELIIKYHRVAKENTNSLELKYKRIVNK